jgi:hypothetical protein
MNPGSVDHLHHFIVNLLQSGPREVRCLSRCEDSWTWGGLSDVNCFYFFHERLYVGICRMTVGEFHER